MTLALLGATHRSVPLALRERLAFTSDQAIEAIGRFRDSFPGREIVLLSTCNRVELYTAGEQNTPPPSGEEMLRFLAECRGIDAGDLAGHLDSHVDQAVVRHLFGVASGLDSMVLGEPQILSQVKQAWAMARERDSTGPLTS